MTDKEMLAALKPGDKIQVGDSRDLLLVRHLKNICGERYAGRELYRGPFPRRQRLQNNRGLIMQIPIELDEDFFDAAFAGHSPRNVAYVVADALNAALNISDQNMRRVRIKEIGDVLAEYDLLEDLDAIIRKANEDAP